MATPSVPATAISSLSTQSSSQTGLAIGSKLMYPNAPLGAQTFWYVVVDLSDLSIAQNIEDTSNDTVPPAVEAYEGKPGFFLFFVAQLQQTNNLPQGALHAFLTRVGAASRLHELEQTVEQFGTGWVNRFSYILGATLDTGDLPGFEVGSTQDYSTLVMSFIPVDVNGTTTYAPALAPAE